MKIDVQNLHSGPFTLNLDHRPNFFDLISDDYEIRENIRGKMIFSLIGNKVLMTGALESVVRTLCVRCLEPVDIALKKDIALIYTPETEKEEDELLLNPNQQETSYFKGKIIFPKKDIRELILIELPEYPKCGESCLGLCPTCGINLNRESCNCGKQEKSPPPKKKSWKDQLKTLRI